MREQAWTAITKLIQSEFNFNQFLLKACSLRCRLYFLARRFHASAALRFVFFRLQNGAVQGVSSPARFLRHQTLLQCNRRRTQNACATACLQVPCKKALPSFRKNKASTPTNAMWSGQAQPACQQGRATAAACCAMARTPIAGR
jgi:hypothetical protein